MFGIHRISANLRARREGHGPARPPDPVAADVDPGQSKRSKIGCCWRLSPSTAWATPAPAQALSGDLRYVITQADQSAGDNTIDFAVTGTITLNSALPDLSNTTGLTDIEGPGAAEPDRGPQQRRGDARFQHLHGRPQRPSQPRRPAPISGGSANRRTAAASITLAR